MKLFLVTGLCWMKLMILMETYQKKRKLMDLINEMNGCYKFDLYFLEEMKSILDSAHPPAKKMKRQFPWLVSDSDNSDSEEEEY